MSRAATSSCGTAPLLRVDGEYREGSLRAAGNVLLVERAELTSGSTFHSAGLVGQLRSFLQVPDNVLAKLKEEPGLAPIDAPVDAVLGALRLAAQGLPLVCVNPCVVFGEGHSQFNTQQGAAPDRFRSARSSLHSSGG